MSAPALERQRPVVRAAGGGFWTALRAEWTKFRTVRGWVIGMIVAGVLIVVMGVLGAGHSNIACPGPHGTTRTGPACVQPLPRGPGGVAVSDSYYLVGQPLAGPGSLTVRMSSLTGQYDGGAGPANPGGSLSGLKPGLQPWSKAGIIITGSTRQGAAYAAIMITGQHGVAMQYDYTQNIAGLPGQVSAAAPRWLRLTRSGNTVTGYDSADGTHWTQVGVAHLPGMTGTVRAGMFAASPAYMHVTQVFGGSQGQVGPSVAAGVFDRVQLAGGPAGGSWTGDNVGNQQPFGPDSGQLVGFHQSGGRFTVTGTGDIAPVVNGAAGTGPTTTIEEHLIGTFAGLIAVVVVAGMFMTAEYRRGLIRLTLAASPRRGQVLAAKAVVVALASFATGLVAAVISVVIGTRMDHSQGMLVLPVSLLTEVRVIAGTAALVAVAAVLALALGTMLRRSAAAVTAAIVVVVLPFILGMGQLLPQGAASWLLRVSPAAAFSIQQSLPQYPQVTNQYTTANEYYPLAPWAGFGVLCLYAAVALAGAFFVLRRRDA